MSSSHLHKKSDALLLIANALLIILFLYAAIVKIMAYQEFEHQLSQQPFPLWMRELLFWLLPSSELLIAFLLFFQNSRLIGFVLAELLLFVFTIYIILILLKVWNRIPCACGGLISSLGW